MFTSEMSKNNRNFAEIKNCQVENIDYRDYPDFCDAYISYAEWQDGTELSEEELDELNMEHRGIRYDKIIEHAR